MEHCFLGSNVIIIIVIVFHISWSLTIDNQLMKPYLSISVPSPFLLFSSLPLSSSSLSKNRPPKPNRNRLLLRIIRQRRFSQLPPDSTLLVPAKRQRMMQHVILIDPHGTCLQRVRHSNRGVQIFSVNRGGKAVGGDVAETDGVGFVFKFRNGAHRAEDFFFHDFHVFAYVAENGGLDEVACVPVTGAAGFDGGAFFFAGVDVAIV